MCQDGVRKKAKYLQDVPADNLMPGVGGHYPSSNGGPYSHTSPTVTMPQSTPYYSAAQPPSNYDIYGQSNQSAMPPPPLSSNGSFSQQSPTSPGFQSLGSQQSPNALASLPPASQSGLTPIQQPFAFDPSDPALFNFDISGLNFGNQYGAMEFGMLGHMAGGAADSPSTSNENLLHGALQMPHTYHPSISSVSAFPDGTNPALMYNQDPMIGSEWQRHNSTSSQFNPPIDGLTRTDSISSHAYAIGAGPGSIASASPSSTGQDFQPQYDNAPSSPALYSSDTSRHYYNLKQHKQRQSSQYQISQPQPQKDTPRRGNLPPQALRQHTAAYRRRRHDHAHIYESVDRPYSYTEGFHSLLAYLRKWYSSDKCVRIGKALAEFRPTLINTYGPMTEQDLTFGEKAFQLLKYEYEDNLLPAYGTPSIIIRRTGEVALATKEFCYMTGWSLNVLTGREPNLNVNMGASTGNHTGASTRGAVNTPKLSTLENNSESVKAAKPRPVLIAELMDHESVVQFFEDFQKHAFVDPSGAEIRSCRLMKYRTKDQNSAGDVDADAGEGVDEQPPAPPKKRVKKEHDHEQIKREEEMLGLGEDEGAVKCMYTWRIKRDMLDAPMMFIINVSCNMRLSMIDLC